MLDAVEHRRETVVINRGGKRVASLAPVPASPGRAVKDVLRRHSPDADWARELHDLRHDLVAEDRSWPA